jgi:hypothetical protein
MKSTETILAEIRINLEHLEENQKKCFKEIKEQIYKSEEKAQKQLDNHCPRIRAMEKNLGEMNVQEEIGEIKKVQAVRISTLTKVIAALAIGATLLAERIWCFIING